MWKKNLNLYFFFKERGRYVLPKESPAQVYLAQADFEMRIGGLATARGLLDKVKLCFLYIINSPRYFRARKLVWSG